MVYHLHINKQSWSTTSLAIKDSMKFIQSLIQEKTGLKVDLPDSSGGTTSTGNVARRAFSDETDYLNCVLSTIANHRPAKLKSRKYYPFVTRFCSFLAKFSRYFLQSEKSFKPNPALDSRINSSEWANILCRVGVILAQGNESKIKR